MKPIIMLMAALALCGCSQAYMDEMQANQKKERETLDSSIVYNNILRYEFDGHLFVVTMGVNNRPSGICHHPDCPCMKGR